MVAGLISEQHWAWLHPAVLGRGGGAIDCRQSRNPHRRLADGEGVLQGATAGVLHLDIHIAAGAAAVADTGGKGLGEEESTGGGGGGGQATETKHVGIVIEEPPEPPI